MKDESATKVCEGESLTTFYDGRTGDKDFDVTATTSRRLSLRLVRNKKKKVRKVFHFPLFGV